MTERANQFHGYLTGDCEKPGRKGIPSDAVLNMWAAGKRTDEIQAAVRRQDGQVYLVQSIYALVRRAREEGDPRASMRR